MIEYRHNYPLNPNEVARVFDSSGIVRPTKDLPRIQRMLESSNLLISAWDENRLIGVARALTDYSYCCYLSDLAVDASYQKRGIGREMLRMVREAIGDDVSLILTSSSGAMDYYPKVGFALADNAFVIRRKR